MCIKCYEIYIALHAASSHAQLDEKSTSKLLLKAWNIDHSLRTFPLFKGPTLSDSDELEIESGNSYV